MAATTGEPRVLDHDRRWLSHHGPEAAERCCSVSGVAVCRRCAVLYPVAVTSAVLTVLVAPPSSVSVLLMWLLPVPMVAEWIAEHLAGVRYSPTRQVVVTAIGAPALGIALAVHALDPFAPAALAPVLTWSAVALVSALWGQRRSGTSTTDWEARHHSEEAARRARLEGLLERTDADRAAGSPSGRS